MSVEQLRGSSSPAFPQGLPLARPEVADPTRVAADVEAILRSGMLTNGAYVRRLEHEAASYLGVAHCVAVSSCTAGLMLVLRAAELTGDVILPSFTFAATAHAVAWNGLSPRFADIDPSHAHALTGGRRPRDRGAHVGGAGDAHLRHAVRRGGARLDRSEQRHPALLRRGSRVRVDPRRREGRRVRRCGSVQPVADQAAHRGRGRDHRHQRRSAGRALPDRTRLCEPRRLRLSVRRARTHGCPSSMPRSRSRRSSTWRSGSRSGTRWRRSTARRCRTSRGSRSLGCRTAIAARTRTSRSWSTRRGSGWTRMR